MSLTSIVVSRDDCVPIPKCTSTKHQEYTCLGGYYQNRKHTRDKWCETCFAFFENKESK